MNLYESILFYRHKVEDILLPDCPQVLFLLNIESKTNSESHKYLVQNREFYYK